MEKLLTVKEVAELLNLSKFAVYDMVYENKIPYVKIGHTNRSLRFDRQKISVWLSKQSNDIILTKK